MLGLRVALLLGGLLAAFAGSAMAGTEFLKSRGPLSDDQFYRTLACSGARDPECENRKLRWPAPQRHNLTVAVAAPGNRVSKKITAEINAAVNRAIAEINGSGADIRLVQVSAKQQAAAITIYPVNASIGGVMKEVASPMMRGSRIQLGHVHVRFRRNTIRTAHIAISRQIPLSQIDSVVLEELVQALGLLTDILNPYYKRRSIFAEDCNCTRTLEGQDQMALQQHYPAR